MSEQEKLAEAWRRGLVSGKSITMRRMSDEPDAPEPENPYDDHTPHTHGGTDAPECTPYGVACKDDSDFR